MKRGFSLKEFLTPPWIETSKRHSSEDSPTTLFYSERRVRNFIQKCFPTFQYQKFSIGIKFYFVDKSNVLGLFCWAHGSLVYEQFGISDHPLWAKKWKLLFKRSKKSVSPASGAMKHVTSSFKAFYFIIHSLYFISNALCSCVVYMTFLRVN